MVFRVFWGLGFNGFRFLWFRVFRVFEGSAGIGLSTYGLGLRLSCLGFSVLRFRV